MYITAEVVNVTAGISMLARVLAFLTVALMLGTMLIAFTVRRRMYVCFLYTFFKISTLAQFYALLSSGPLKAQVNLTGSNY